MHIRGYVQILTLLIFTIDNRWILKSVWILCCILLNCIIANHLSQVEKCFLLMFCFSGQLWHPTLKTNKKKTLIISSVVSLHPQSLINIFPCGALEWKQLWTQAELMELWSKIGSCAHSAWTTISSVRLELTWWNCFLYCE